MKDDVGKQCRILYNKEFHNSYKPPNIRGSEIKKAMMEWACSWDEEDME
jgi:hypothetical protein